MSSMRIFRRATKRWDSTGPASMAFQNSYTLAVRKEAADQYSLKTFTDLAAVSDQLVFGGQS